MLRQLLPRPTFLPIDDTVSYQPCNQCHDVPRMQHRFERQYQPTQRTPFVMATETPAEYIIMSHPKIKEMLDMEYIVWSKSHKQFRQTMSWYITHRSQIQGSRYLMRPPLIHFMRNLNPNEFAYYNYHKTIVGCTDVIDDVAYAIHTPQTLWEIRMRDDNKYDQIMDLMIDLNPDNFRFVHLQTAERCLKAVSHCDIACPLQYVHPSLRTIELCQKALEYNVKNWVYVPRPIQLLLVGLEHLHTIEAQDTNSTEIPQCVYALIYSFLFKVKHESFGYIQTTTPTVSD